MLIVTVLVAAALLGAGGALQVRRTRRAVSAVKALLAERDPSRRLLGVERAEQEGVALHAVALLRASGRERDEVVADAIAAAVRRALWEPTQSAEVKALRRWAASRPIATDRQLAAAPAGEPGTDDHDATLVAVAPMSLGERIRAIVAEPLLRVRLQCSDEAIDTAGVIAPVPAGELAATGVRRRTGAEQRGGRTR